MLITSITNFRNNAKEWLDKITNNSEELAITTKKGNYIIVEEAEYRSWKETSYILSDKDIVDEIKQSDHDRKEGRSKSFDNVDDLFNHLDEL
ncbi:type II toxin-antitoxin system Phd/YefM family antitoxin [Flammeovirga yaeyamensis]|uniref:Antitoxin n=1 Tax=Flammeovirga yaeyamensis TaxID=367791 RepID=A0AAX1MZI9_9BACT|nr:type II toxin-antitoxin system Phd/YefM family antitoxin [Flammeovirga yaeyamensis]MBB3700886.1 PHD/YefM family antitoxin component YafN of YafNO toxin-antitoxin module [Flammeovirga yaeyamensis]NMF37994.1 type II toxin-antitoxin system Phd/YefM family antitoxin [Flammeovirga yaeyamensis]QWG00645.1 type II toxin-antitoxin system Phd/YefM family antitoxin [Flammeovirga yaeyamensis]